MEFWISSVQVLGMVITQGTPGSVQDASDCPNEGFLKATLMVLIGVLLPFLSEICYSFAQRLGRKKECTFPPNVDCIEVDVNFVTVVYDSRVLLKMHNYYKRSPSG